MLAELELGDTFSVDMKRKRVINTNIGSTMLKLGLLSEKMNDAICWQMSVIKTSALSVPGGIKDTYKQYYRKIASILVKLFHFTNSSIKIRCSLGPRT